MAGNQLCGTIGSEFRPRFSFGPGDSGTSGVRTEELAQSGKALPACAGSVLAVFRRVAMSTPHQSAVLLIWIGVQENTVLC